MLCVCVWGAGTFSNILRENGERERERERERGREREREREGGREGGREVFTF